METEYLREFLAVVERGSFSVAAADLFISQSSLSKHINILEKQLGFRLFDRTTRAVSLSEYGTLILPYVKAITVNEATIISKLADITAARDNFLRVASIPVMDQYGITELIFSFRRAHPEIELQVMEIEARDISSSLTRGECDLAFQGFMEGAETALDFIELFTDWIVAVLPQNHPLAGMSQIPLDMLRDEVFLFLDEDTNMYPICMEVCATAGFKPRMAYKGQRPENIIGLVSRGMGVSLLMKRQAEFFRDHGVVCVEIQPVRTSHVCLSRDKSNRFSPSAQLFWNYVKVWASVQ